VRSTGIGCPSGWPSSRVVHALALSEIACIGICAGWVRAFGLDLEEMGAQPGEALVRQGVSRNVFAARPGSNLKLKSHGLSRPDRAARQPRRLKLWPWLASRTIRTAACSNSSHASLGRNCRMRAAVSPADHAKRRFGDLPQPSPEAWSSLAGGGSSRKAGSKELPIFKAQRWWGTEGCPLGNPIFPPQPFEQGL
jgi:hypothetical protein